MKLEKFEIGKYKNLQDFEVEFNDTSNLTVLVGRNGSGKSNFLEAISLVFSSIFTIASVLDRNVEYEYKAIEIYNLDIVEFNYKLQFTNKQKRVEIEYEANLAQGGLILENNQFDAFTIKIDNEVKSFKELVLYIPKSIFGYYSGETSRLRNFFITNQNTYRKALKENLLDTEFPRLFFVNEKVLEYIIFVNKVFSLRNDIANTYVKETVEIATSFILSFNSPKNDEGDKYHNLEGQQLEFLEMLSDIGIHRLGKKRSN